MAWQGWQRNERRLVTGLVGLVLLAVALGPALRFARERAQLQAGRALLRLERELGGQLELTGLQAEPWGRLRLQGVVLRAGAAPGAARLLSVQELDLQLSPLDWLRGQRLPRSVEARGVELHLEGAAGQEWAGRVLHRGWGRLGQQAGEAEARHAGGLLSQLPARVVLHDLELHAGGDGAEATFSERLPLLMLLAPGDELSGVVELAADRPGETRTSYLKISGQRGEAGWQVRVEAAEPLYPDWVRQRLGRRIGLRSVALGPGGLELEQLTVSVPATQGTEVMARAARVALRGSLSPRRPRLLVQLDEPELTLESYPGGHHNLEELQPLLAAALRLAGSSSTRRPGSPAVDGPRPRSSALPEFELSVRRGTLHLARYRERGDPERLTLQGLDFALQPTGEQLGLTASWNPGPGQGRLVVEGYLDPRPGHAFSLRLRPDRLELAELGRHSTLDLRGGQASGDLVLARQGERLSLVGSLTLSELAFSWRLLAGQALAGLNTRMDFTLSSDLAASRFELESLAATVGELELSAWGTLQRQDASLRYDMTVAMGPVPCRDIPSSLPRGLIPLLEGLKLDGHASVRIRATGDLFSDEPPAIHLDGTTDGFRVVRDAGPDLAGLQRPFTHTAFGPDGQPVTVSVDPTVPGFTTYEGVSAYLRRAVVSAEDTSFYQHHGVDFGQIEASLQRNLQEGRIARGGSTLTQQVVKNLFLSREKTLSRKLQEAYLAWKLEQSLDKRRILEIYLNIIEWGPSVFGARAASRWYFDKAPAGLTLTESVFLAAIIPNPGGFARQVRLGEVPPELTERMHKVLRRMRELDFISEAELQRSWNHRPALRHHPELLPAEILAVRPDVPHP